MVWFHGGGFVAGSAAGRWQDGGRLCRRGNVVVVSVNHRLNVLGHLFLDRLSAAFAGAGNAGLLDLVLALSWVRDHIARFGGDPGNVTIFGQSGGGQKVSMLLAMPAAMGLFHKAIVQSGPAPKALEPDYATDLAQRFLGKLAIGTPELERLQQVPLDQILRAYFAVFRETGGFGVLGILQGFAPVVDGQLLPQHPFHREAPQVSADVPLLIGTTRTEMTLNTLLKDPTADRMDEATLLAHVSDLFGPDAKRVVDAYRTSHPGGSPWELYALISSDWPTRLYSIWIAERKARLRRAPVFMYRTDWRTPVGGGKLMSPHAIDIGFVLDDTPYTASFDSGGRAPSQMAGRMSEAWLAFARHGDPNIRALPHWPKYEPDGGRTTLVFDTRCHVVDDPDGVDRRALDALLAKR
jgi:para-nitrobenzyl esterase